MAAAFFNATADGTRARAISAGTQPGEHVHPEVVAVMREVGIDLSRARPQRLTEELARGATLLVTMGCGDECPVVPGVRRDDWPLVDPKGKAIDEVRRIRDEIRERVAGLLDIEGWTTSADATSAATTTLFRPVGQKELDLIRESGYRRFPPRLAGQPIFYPVCNEEYATLIAHRWNTKDEFSGNVGYVTRFQVRTSFVQRYPVQTVGSRIAQELWVPANELEQFNDNIVGLIEVIAEYRPG